MKPLKGLYPFANWLLRLSVLAFCIITYSKIIKYFEVQSLQFWLALTFIVSGLLLFIGGFLSKHTLTMIAAIILCLISGYKIFTLYESIASVGTLFYFVLLSLGIYFLSVGNSK